MTLERFLLIAGRILSIVFAFFLALHLVVTMIVTNVFHAAATTPQAFAENLQEDDFRSQLGSAAFAVVLNALPPEVEIGSTSISTGDLVRGLLAVDWRELGAQVGSGNLANALISDILTSIITRIRGEVQETVSQQAAVLSDRFSGRPAYQIAQLVVSAVQACTQDQIDRLLAAAESSNFTAIDFLCNPTTSGDNLQGVMRDIIIVALGNLADTLVQRADQAVQSLGLQDIQLDTPIGSVSLDWPEIVLTRGNFSINVPLPANLVASVEGAVSSLQERVGGAVEQLNTQVEQSQADLEALATEIASDAQGTATAAAPTLTLPPTETPTPAPTPETTPEPPSPVSAAITSALNDLTIQLVALATTINGWLWAGFAVDLVITLITVLFLLRRWAHMGLWSGIVLAASGICLLIVNFVVGGMLQNLAVTPYPNEIAEVAQLQSTLRNALADAIYSGFNQSLILPGIIALAAGIALIALVLVMKRRSAADTETETPAEA